MSTYNSMKIRINRRMRTSDDGPVIEVVAVPKLADRRALAHPCSEEDTAKVDETLRRNSKTNVELLLLHVEVALGRPVVEEAEREELEEHVQGRATWFEASFLRKVSEAEK
jgi:hypothetical protein